MIRCPKCLGSGAFFSVLSRSGLCPECKGTGVRTLRVSHVHGVKNYWDSNWFYEFDAATPYAENSPVNWGGTGTMLGDVFQFYRDARRESWILRVKSQIKEQTPDVVVGHSMGSVLALEALARMGHRPRLVLIGSPLHHKVLGPALELKAKALVKCESFWHDRDPITRGGRKTKFTSTRIWVSGSGDQHRAELYLDHPQVQGAIRDQA